jgi:hypothetical protein
MMNDDSACDIRDGARRREDFPARSRQGLREPRTRAHLLRAKDPDE